MSNDARRLIEDYVRDAAQHSGLPEPQRSDARAELESHLHEAASALAEGQALTTAHVRQAITQLGDRSAIDAAFFAPHRSGAVRAAWGRRIGAFAIDTLLVLIATSLFLAPFGMPWDGDAGTAPYECHGVFVFGVKVWTSEEHAPGTNPCDDIWAAQALHQVVHGLGFLLYFGLLEGALGRTPGKMALGLRVLRDDGNAAGFGRAFGRSLSKALFPLVVLDWLLGLTTKGRRQTISDLAAHTMVVRDP